MKQMLLNGVLLTALTMSFGFSSTAQAEDEFPEVLMPGVSLDYDTSPNGQNYLALHKDARRGWQLTEVRVGVSRRDPDSVEIIASQQGTRSLLRHPALRPGAVTVAWLDDWPNKDNSQKAPGALLLIELGDVIALHLGNAPARVVLADKALHLEAAGKQTVLYEALAGYYTAALEWAGDLDRDGRLDLLLSFSNDKNGEVCLFLSSQAEAGELVKNIDCFFGSG